MNRGSKEKKNNVNFLAEDTDTKVDSQPDTELEVDKVVQNPVKCEEVSFERETYSQTKILRKDNSASVMYTLFHKISAHLHSVHRFVYY